jgi:hypothetical protein
MFSADWEGLKRLGGGFGRCPICRVWIGPFRRPTSFNAGQTLKCHGCLTELQKSGFRWWVILFGVLGFFGGIAMMAVLWIAVGYQRGLAAIPVAVAILGAQVARAISPLEVASEPGSAPRSKSIPRSIV